MSPLTRSLAAVALGLLFAAAASAQDGPGKPIKTTVAYEPVIALAPESRELTACGVQITVLRDDQPLITTSLTQRREGEQTRVLWCSLPRDLLQATPRTGVAALEVRSTMRLETPINLPGASPRSRCTAIEDNSLLFQRLFLSGGTLRIALEDQPTLSVTLQRPLPAALRSAYLNCAGDLFRPEDAD
ncbi:MAG: hypothetical protein AAGA68_04855 [Pseudomonadota bacterium]